MSVTLIIGPPDSGKSDLAERRVLAATSARPLYVGTLPRVTRERQRIVRHAARRGHAWDLVEIRRDLAEAADWLRDRGERVTLVDGVSAYIARCMHRDLAVTGVVDEAEIAAHAAFRLREIAAVCTDLFIVTSVRRPDCGPPDAFDRIHNAMVERIATMCGEIVELGGAGGQNHLG